MAGSQSDPTVRVRADGATPVRRIGRICTGAGLLVGAASLAVVVLSLPVVAAGSVTGTAVRFGDLLGTPIAALSGVELAVYAGAVGLLAACWFLGAGLLIDGLFDESPRQ